MSSIGVNEICKVRSNAICTAGSSCRGSPGYCLGIVKRNNRLSARVALVDERYIESDRTYLVDFGVLWKLKAQTRKNIARKITKAKASHNADSLLLTTLHKNELDLEILNELIPQPLYLSVDHSDVSWHSVQSFAQIKLGRSAAILHIVRGSITDFDGDAIVNAANEGCIGGGGIDGEINYLGGSALHEARRNLPLLDGGIRCATGDAKITISGELPCKHVVHAVGPNFCCDADMSELLDLLKDAYKNALARAQEYGLKSVAFCILSAGIFRGSCPLKTVIKTAIDTIAEHAGNLENVGICAFTTAEFDVAQSCVQDIICALDQEIDNHAVPTVSHSQNLGM